MENEEECMDIQDELMDQLKDQKLENFACRIPALDHQQPCSEI